MTEIPELTQKDLDRAIRILSSLKPAGSALFQKPLDAAREAIEIQTAVSDNQNRLVDLHHRVEALKVWGNVRLKQFEDLRASGVEVRFFSVPQKQADNIQAECADFLMSQSRPINARSIAEMVDMKPAFWGEIFPLPDDE